MTENEPDQTTLDRVVNTRVSRARTGALALGVAATVLGGSASGQPLIKPKTSEHYPQPVKELIQPGMYDEGEPDTTKPERATPSSFSAEPLNLVRDNQPDGRTDYSVLLEGPDGDYVQGVPASASAPDNYQVLHLLKQEIRDGDNENITLYKAQDDWLAEDPEHKGFHVTESGMQAYNFDGIRIEGYTFGR